MKRRAEEPKFLAPCSCGLSSLSYSRTRYSDVECALQRHFTPVVLRHWYCLDVRSMGVRFGRVVPTKDAQNSRLGQQSLVMPLLSSNNDCHVETCQLDTVVLTLVISDLSSWPRKW
jgi:hypothetical protein